MKGITAERAGTSTGFMGCLRDVQIGRNAISIQSEHEPKIMQRKNLVECSENPCSRLPCANGGSCEAQKDQGYVCNCKPNFTGRQCQRPRDPCHPNPCQNHGQCLLDDLKGFVCMCPKEGFSGRLCEIDNSSDESKRIRKSLEHDGKEKIQFSLRTNVTNEDGKLFSFGLDDLDETLDVGLNADQELWVELFKQRLVQPTLIVPDEWYKVTIIKQHHRFSLRVDDHHELLHLDESWPKISFSDKPIQFSGKIIIHTKNFEKSY